MMRILLVDDDVDLREALTVALSHEGYEVETFSSAEAALEQLPGEKIDLVITDLMLPGIDGAEFCRLLRKQCGDEAFKILMLSNMPAEMGIEITDRDAAWAPTDRFVDKRASMAEIMAAVHELLRRDDEGSSP